MTPYYCAAAYSSTNSMYGTGTEPISDTVKTLNFTLQEINCINNAILK